MIWAIEDIFTAANFEIAVIAALVMLYIEFLPEQPLASDSNVKDAAPRTVDFLLSRTQFGAGPSIC